MGGTQKLNSRNFFTFFLKTRRVDIFTKVSIKQPSDFTISFPFFENVGRVSRIFLFFISKIVCKNEISKTECFVYIRLRFSQRVRADLSAEDSNFKTKTITKLCHKNVLEFSLISPIFLLFTDIQITQKST